MQQRPAARPRPNDDDVEMLVHDESSSGVRWQPYKRAWSRAFLQISQHMARVATGIRDEIFLVIFLRRIKFPGGGYLRRDRPFESSRLAPFFLHSLGGLFLSVAGVENGGAILRAHVRSEEHTSELQSQSNLV